jgi:hypothetical protein
MMWSNHAKISFSVTSPAEYKCLVLVKFFAVWSWKSAIYIFNCTVEVTQYSVHHCIVSLRRIPQPEVRNLDDWMKKGEAVLVLNIYTLTFLVSMTAASNIHFDNN